MRRPLTLATVPTLAVMGLAAVPAMSSAATIMPGAACYSTDSASGPSTRYAPMTGTLSGGVPGGRFDIYAEDSKTNAFVGNYDAAGNAAYQINVYPDPGRKPSKGRSVKLTVRDYAPGVALPTESGSTEVKVSTTSVDYASSPQRLLASRTVRASAPFFAGKRIYGFITRGTKSSRVLKRISLGKANACGYVSDKEVIVPRSVRTGTYRLWVNVGTKLKKTDVVFINIPAVTIRVPR